MPMDTLPTRIGIEHRIAIPVLIWMHRNRAAGKPSNGSRRCKSTLLRIVPPCAQIDHPAIVLHFAGEAGSWRGALSTWPPGRR